MIPQWELNCKLVDFSNIINFSSFDQALNKWSVLLSSEAVSRTLNETAHLIVLSLSCKIPCCTESVPKTKISVIPRSNSKQKQLLQTKKGISHRAALPWLPSRLYFPQPQDPLLLGGTWLSWEGRQKEGKKKCTWVSFPSAPQSTISSYCSLLCTTQNSKNAGSHQVFLLSRIAVSLIHFQNWSKSWQKDFSYWEKDCALAFRQALQKNFAELGYQITCHSCFSPNIGPRPVIVARTLAATVAIAESSSKLT